MTSLSIYYRTEAKLNYRGILVSSTRRQVTTFAQNGRICQDNANVGMQPVYEETKTACVRLLKQQD